MNFTETVGLALAIGGAIWKISLIQSDIYKYIDKENGDIKEEISLINMDLSTFKTSCSEQEEFTTYKINALHESLDHKSKRLESGLQEIKNTLRDKGIF
jgi:chaperonin cofactor prefoldin